MTEAERIQSIKEKCGRHLQNFKEENITYTMCLVAVEMDGSAIEFVPEKFKTEELYKLACKTHGALLQIMPREYVSEEVCNDAVKSYGPAIEYVPEVFKTREVYLLAAQGSPEIWKEIPEEYITVDLCIDLFKRHGKLINYLPKSLQNGKFYLQLVQNYPNVIWDIPKAGRTAKICRAAIQSMGKTVAEAVQENPKLLTQLHPSLYDHDSCLAFVSSSFFKENVKNNFRFLHYGFGSAENLNKGILPIHVPHHEYRISLREIMRWTDVCESVIKVLPISIAYIEEDLLSQEMCLGAISRDVRAFKYVPEKHRTQELCLHAVKEAPHLIKDIPEKYISNFM